jgi:geranylgeranyl diphosphate synthase type I
MGKPAFLDLKMNRPTLVMILATNDGLSREKMLSMDRQRLLGALGPYIDEAGAIAAKKAAEAKGSLNGFPDGVALDRLEALCDYVVSRSK